MTLPDWDARFHHAVMQHGIQTQRFNIAGRSLRVEVAGDSIAALVFPAFAPLMAETPAAQESGQLLIWADDDQHHSAVGEALGPMRLPNGGLLVPHALSSSAEAFVPDHTMMLWGPPDGLASGDIQAQPASSAIAAWLAQAGTLVLHAGAVGDRNGAALLLGRGGTGKSTTALACAIRGMGVLGDDFCAVTTSGPPIVHGIYATAKITHDSWRHLSLNAHPALARDSTDKKVLALSDGCFIRKAPIVAVIVLAKSSGDSAPTPLSRNDVMRALAPTALKATIGAYSLRQWLRTAAPLAREIPGFLVNIDWDLGAVARSIGDAIAMGKTVLSR